LGEWCWEQTVNKLCDNLWAGLHAGRGKQTPRSPNLCTRLAAADNTHTRSRERDYVFKGVKNSHLVAIYFFIINTGKGRKRIALSKLFGFSLTALLHSDPIDVSLVVCFLF
jgi:hypothetical protein